jgi:hypothetical protein
MSDGSLGISASPVLLMTTPLGVPEMLLDWNLTLVEKIPETVY